MNLSAQILRIKVDTANMESLKDATSGQPLRCWKGNDIRLQIGFFLGNTVLSIGEIASVTVQIQATRAGTLLISRTVGPEAFDNGLTAASWTAATAQHVQLDITAAETELLSITTGTTATFWMVIAAVTTHSPAKNLTANAGQFMVYEDGYTPAGLASAPIPAASYYTAEEADARFQQLRQPNALAVWHNGTWYHYVAGAAFTHYPLVPILKDGVVVVGIGQGVNL
jgi:hypothetical protein